MIYWISTGLVAIFLATSAGAYLLHPPTIEGIRELGFPDFFRIELAVLKILALPVLLIPQIPAQAKEWAYAGVAFFLITSIVAHHVHRDPVVLNLINVTLLGLLAASYLHLPR